MFEGEIEDAGGDDEIGPVESLDINELLRNTTLAMAQQSRMEWERYAAAAMVHRKLVEPTAGTEAEMRVLDPFTQCAARLAVAQGLTQRTAELQINRGVALRDRLPAVNALLKAGRVAAHYIPDIVARTELIDGSAHATEIDAAIAEALARQGSWSKGRMRDMVDAIIFRRDPDLVRQAREDAQKNRGVWGSNADHGMAVLDAHSSAEEITMIMARLERLAMATCAADPRRKSDRMADALFATVMGREFYCQCPNDPKHPCTAEIITVPADQVISGVDVKIVMHVITDQATFDGAADHPGFLDGHGVISGDHVRDIANRPETITRPMGNTFEPVQPKTAEPAPAPAPAPAQPEAAQSQSAPPAPPAPADPEPVQPPVVEPPPTAEPRRTVYMRGPQNPALGEFPDATDVTEAPFLQAVPLPATQPGDAYRPSAVLDSYLRIRDIYCMWPGCEHKAWRADLDHTHEYDRACPEAGGCTHPDEMKTLCRFHHLLKTYSDWLDDQYPDPKTGRTRLIVTTPESRHYHGPVWTGDDLFPTLRLIVFDQRGSPGATPPRTPPRTPPPPSSRRSQTRTAAKHARRQQERLANRRLREQEADHRKALAEERGRNSPPPTY